MYHAVYESRNVGTERETERGERREHGKWAQESLNRRNLDLDSFRKI